MIKLNESTINIDPNKTLSSNIHIGDTIRIDNPNIPRVEWLEINVLDIFYDSLTRECNIKYSGKSNLGSESGRTESIKKFFSSYGIKV